jgi:hypothetical protein
MMVEFLYPLDIIFTIAITLFGLMIITAAQDEGDKRTGRVILLLVLFSWLVVPISNGWLSVAILWFAISGLVLGFTKLIYWAFIEDAISGIKKIRISIHDER